MTLFKTQQFQPFLSKNFRFNKAGTSNLQALMETPEMQNYLFLGNVSIEVMQRYHEVINQSLKIIGMINQQYKN